jgi:SulP family sulfate permease
MDVGDIDTGIATVGALPAGLPPLSKPNLSFDLVETLGASVLAIAVLDSPRRSRLRGRLRSSRISGSMATRIHRSGPVQPHGQPLSSYATSGSFTRSGLNYDAGAKTPLAAVFAAYFSG